MQHFKDIENAYRAMSVDARKEARDYMKMMAIMSPVKAELRLVVSVQVKVKTKV